MFASLLRVCSRSPLFRSYGVAVSRLGSGCQACQDRASRGECLVLWMATGRPSDGRFFAAFSLLHIVRCFLHFYALHPLALIPASPSFLALACLPCFPCLMSRTSSTAIRSGLPFNRAARCAQCSGSNGRMLPQSTARSPSLLLSSCPVLFLCFCCLPSRRLSHICCSFWHPVTRSTVPILVVLLCPVRVITVPIRIVSCHSLDAGCRLNPS